jgi:hypothetical protein
MFLYLQLLNITSKNSVVQQQPYLSPPPPPTPPKHNMRLPSPLHTAQSKGIQPCNRASMLPISPGISPAVNYMLQQQQTPPAVSIPDAAKPPSSQPQPQPQPQQTVPYPREVQKMRVKRSSWEAPLTTLLTRGKGRSLGGRASQPSYCSSRRFDTDVETRISGRIYLIHTYYRSSGQQEAQCTHYGC